MTRLKPVTAELPAGETINYDDIILPPVDYSGLSRKDLVATLALIVENRPPAEIVEDVSRIKEFFYKKTKVEFNEKDSILQKRVVILKIISLSRMSLKTGSR